MTGTGPRGDLAQSLDAIRGHLSRYAGLPAESNEADRAVASSQASVDGLAQITDRFGLSPFESDVLVLAAGSELDPDIPALCALAHRDPAQPWPTFGLAMAALPGAHWDALSPDCALRSAALVHVDQRCPVLTGARLSVDERILFALLGLDVLDPRLVEITEPQDTETPTLPRSHDALVQDICAWWLPDGQPPLAIRSEYEPDRDAVVVALTERIAAPRCWRVGAAALASAGSLTADLRRRLSRESQLTGAPIVVETDDAEPGQLPLIHSWIRRLVDTGARVLVASRAPVAGLPHVFVPVDVPTVSFAEHTQLWQTALGPAAFGLNGRVERLAGQFRLSAADVDATASHVLSGEMASPTGEVDAEALADRLWVACRDRARADLDGLAERITPGALASDLVLPPRELASLEDLIRHARHRAQVYEDWRIAGPNQQGSGVAALFSGPSGSGKSLAAEVIAGRLEVELYRIDLSCVVSKYIGETEKNLRRVFNAAERSGAVLLIDEADALFGKRSEVKDSHDRYANIEVSYLLQLMESYRGLAILTSNLRASIDEAFVRRLDFIIAFPFPDTSMRNSLWRKAFDARVPCSELDVNQLAQLNLSGGSIRNVAVHAAFLAAERGSPVTMSDLLRGARSEYAKLNRPLTQTELAGWAQ